MIITFFGMYTKNYARTSTLREGLARFGITIREIHEEVPNERMELPEDFTVGKTLHRMFRKIASFIRLVFRSFQIRGSKAIIVLHPGHLELPLAYILAKMFRIPLLFDSSISPYDTMFVGRAIAKRTSLKAKLVKFVESMLLKLPDRIFVDTDGMGEFLSQELGVSKSKLFTVPLGANDAIYRPLYKKKRSKQVSVLFFGLYNPMHGAPTILQAAKLLSNQKHIRFTMLGDGYLKEDFIKYVKDNRLNNVRFVGFMPEEQLVKQIQAADILLGVFSKSSLFERVIPNKVFAALACKKALITADRREVSSMFKNNTEVVLCSPEDPTSLAQAIMDLAGSSKKTRAHSSSGVCAIS